MKILSPWSLELPECQIHRMIEYSDTRYLLLFDCGLVMTSWFWRLNGDKTKWYALELHRNHHQENHLVTTANGIYGFYKVALYDDTRYGRGRPIRNYTIACGVGCKSFSDSSRALMVARSDLLIPMAKVQEGLTSYEITLTATNEFVCSCSPKNQGKDSCSHVIGLLTTTQKNILGIKSPLTAIRKRKIRFDE